MNMFRLARKIQLEVHNYDGTILRLLNLIRKILKLIRFSAL